MRPRDINIEQALRYFIQDEIFRKMGTAKGDFPLQTPSFHNSAPLSSPTKRYVKQMGLLRTMEDLEDIYSNLTKNSAYIPNSYPFDKFRLHFTGIGELYLQDKIPWMEQENVLSHIIIVKMMKETVFIPESHRPHKLICSHFIWIKDGRAEEFDPEHMRKNHHNGLGDIYKISAINKMFAKFSE